MDEEEGYLIEFYRIGPQVKVTACDSATGIEVSVMAPSSLSRKELSDLAIRKLRYVMDKKAGG